MTVHLCYGSSQTPRRSLRSLRDQVRTTLLVLRAAPSATFLSPPVLTPAHIEGFLELRPVRRGEAGASRAEILGAALNWTHSELCTTNTQF